MTVCYTNLMCFPSTTQQEVCLEISAYFNWLKREIISNLHFNAIHLDLTYLDERSS